MERYRQATISFNAGIVVVSYLISIVGSMTTLELLQRRTHITGKYNWFLLFTAAASMGGVGIWCMHFIGNNSLRISIGNDKAYQLSYRPGFTFTSLIVAIVTMFLAFIFVGITEEVKVFRIGLSGFVAGLGIVSMHYLGQVAIEFFTMENDIAYVIGALIIAICATTTAFFIFFKLREQWENQWYKRLGCAMLMSVAICDKIGMHYTALLGTTYYPGDLMTGPPNPVLSTPSLIGTITGIVVVSCCILVLIVAKTRIENNKLSSQKENKRLILNAVFFDTHGRILVKVDGIVPMKEVLESLPEHSKHGQFTSQHPLFIRLYEASIDWSEKKEYDGFNTEDTLYDSEHQSFLTSARELMNDLRLNQLSDLGYLYDNVLMANTLKGKRKPTSSRKSQQTNSHLLSSVAGDAPRSSSTMTVIDIFDETVTPPAPDLATVDDSDIQDQHIFLIKRIESTKDLVHLLSIGFRFAEPIFISKMMGQKLNVSSDTLHRLFSDMLRMVQTADQILTDTSPTVLVGLFCLMGGQVLIDTESHHSIPVVPLGQTSLEPDQNTALRDLTDQTLLAITQLDTTDPFLRSLRQACQHLMARSVYGRHLASVARLDLIDIPAFAIRSGPCQLVVFRAKLEIDWAITINLTLTEKVRCVPFEVHRAFAQYVTELAVQRYQARQAKPCLDWVRQVGLSPPPRLKKPRLILQGALEQVVTSPIELSSTLAVLNILPAQDRFWWLKNLFEETLG